MSVSTVTSASASAAAPAPASAATSSADAQDRFLKLLVTQLNNQDPLNPLDNAQLTSQLAQMSTVSGIEQLNTTVQALLDQSGAGQALQAASMIGHAVLAPGSDMSGGGGSPSAFAVDLPSSAGSVKVSVVDAAGNTVRTIDMGTLPQGLHSAVWDGANDAGQAMPAGVYSIQVAATNGATSVAAQSLVYSQVGSVTQANGGVTLDLDSGRSISLADVRKIL
jgi:flagellar basal-body rod modification protein FlgD